MSSSKVNTEHGEAQTIGGTPYGEHLKLKENGQQTDYVVLTAEERAKGFVEPVRTAYVHEKCGAVTTMGRALAETYAREPSFYSGTFCVGCGAHFPVGEDGEFLWHNTSQKVGARAKLVSAPTEPAPAPAPDLSRARKLARVISGLTEERWSSLSPLSVHFYDLAAVRALAWMDVELKEERAIAAENAELAAQYRSLCK